MQSLRVGKPFKEICKLCTVKNATQIMVCDVSRDAVKEAVSDPFGDRVAMTVQGEGTLFACLDPSRATEFQHRVCDALGWPEENWSGAIQGTLD